MYVKVVESFAYDGLGSMMRRSNWAYAYDFQEELVQAKSTSPAYTCTYSYDGTGRKVEEVDHMASTYTSYFAYVGSRLAYTYNATSGVKSSFVYLGDQLLFRIDSGSTTAHFYATDLSNDVRLVWNDPSGTVNVELKQRYKPFGELATPLNTASTDPRFRYAEQSYSSPTKLYAMGARSYAPDLGRFTSRDPVGGHGYAYANENPLSFWDPSGRDAWSTIGGLIGWSWNTLTGTLGGVVNNLVNYGTPWAPYQPLGPNGPPMPGDALYGYRKAWRGIPLPVRQAIILGGGLVLATLLTMGIADVVDVPAALAGAADWVSGSLATIGGALGVGGAEDLGDANSSISDAAGTLWDFQTPTPSAALRDASAADGGEDVYALASDFHATDMEGRAVTIPGWRLDHILNGPSGNHIEQIMDKFDLESYEDAFGLIKQTIEGAQPVQDLDRPGFLTYDLNGLHVVARETPDGTILWTVYPK